MNEAVAAGFAADPQAEHAPVIGLDTNVLVRYLVQDDPSQSARAMHLIEKRLTQSNPGFISIVAMVETVWVLERAYDFSRQQIADAH